jgi:hypothetical protein
VYDTSTGDYPDPALELALMEEYLSEHGHSFDGLASLADDDRDGLMMEAAAYAAMRVAELVYGS